MSSDTNFISRDKYEAYGVSKQLELRSYKMLHQQNQDIDYEIYIVDSPPPNLSGNLHIGHIFNCTQPDAIHRFYAIKGFKSAMGANMSANAGPVRCEENKNTKDYCVVVPFGIDNNGIPTWKLLLKEVGEKYFNASCLELMQAENNLGVMDKYAKEYEALLDSACILHHKNYKYRTLSDTTQKLAQTRFIDLYKSGDIYHKEAPVNWDTVYCTAVSNMELVTKEKSTEMHYIKFGCVYDDGVENLVDNSADAYKPSNVCNNSSVEPEINITIATTRPELLPACAAVFYHPSQSLDLAGKFVKLPISGRKIPLLADDKVDPEKGTGYVMCCTFGDQVDVHWWQTHQLPLRQIITQEGKIDMTQAGNETELGELYSIHGLKVSEARKKIIHILKEHGLVEKSASLMHYVQCAERSGAPVEILNKPQWYLKTLAYKEQILQAANAINWQPEHMKRKLEEWVHNLNSDWCISRQRPWGIPVPIYYDEGGNIVLPQESDLPVLHGSNNNLAQDPNVLDTWFTSALTPEIVLNTISQDSQVSSSILEEINSRLSNSSKDEEGGDAIILDKAPLTNSRFQAHEIIRTWTFGTILRSIMHHKTLPWSDILITGWCLADDGSKFSKSKGNALDVNQLISKYGIDAIRYWALKHKIGNDIAFSVEMVSNGKKFIDKIINASKFCTRNFDLLLQETQKSQESYIKTLEGLITYDTDISFLAKAQNVFNQIPDMIAKYETASALNALESLFKAEFCDQYLELIKQRFYGKASNFLDKIPEQDSSIILPNQLSACAACAIFMNIFLRSLAPFLPKLSEYMYVSLFDKFVTTGKDSTSCKDIVLDELYTWYDFQVGNIAKDNHSIANITRAELASYKLPDTSFDLIVEIMNQVRKFKTNNRLAMNAPMKFVLIQVLDPKISIDALFDIRNAANTQQVGVLNNANIETNLVIADSNEPSLPLEGIETLKPDINLKVRCYIE